MAILLKPDGSETEVKAKVGGFKLEELYQLIECDMVQMIYLADGRTMWLDEEAKLKQKLPKYNPKATALLVKAGDMPGDQILGNALICSDGEVD